MCKQKLREAGISLRPTEPSSGTPDPTSTGRRRRVFCPAQSVPRTNGQRSPTMQANPDLGFRQSGEHRIVGGNLRPQALMPSSRTPQGTPRAGRRCFRNCRANTSRESGANPWRTTRSFGRRRPLHPVRERTVAGQDLDVGSSGRADLQHVPPDRLGRRPYELRGPPELNSRPYQAINTCRAIF